MACFTFSSRAKQRSHVVLAFNVGLVREIQVSTVGLGLACEGCLEVFFRLGAFECCHEILLSKKDRVEQMHLRLVRFPVKDQQTILQMESFNDWTIQCR
jgi:hypothetical protein